MMKRISVSQYGGWDEYGDEDMELTIGVKVYDLNQDTSEVCEAIKRLYNCNTEVFKTFTENDHIDLRIRMIVKSPSNIPDVDHSELRLHLQEHL